MKFGANGCHAIDINVFPGQGLKITLRADIDSGRLHVVTAGTFFRQLLPLFLLPVAGMGLHAIVFTGQLVIFDIVGIAETVDGAGVIEDKAGFFTRRGT
ncbi:hypothetical protein Xsto_00441 [Xenorhabdus stockiae]|uniref:Uncharacterized protein n=1 Tax=Xenorhabdus stockiae TaxID=351614 RepID=A0A2D0KUS5_9GAMM|nr:hypothetical protein Xsto_00441 [Xenorhabdus stockiae]